MTPTIRLAVPADGPSLAEIYRPAVVGSVISFELEPPDGAAMAQRVARVMTHAPWLVYVRDADVVGYAYAGRHSERAAYDWSVDVSVYVHPEARREGVARALYGSLFPALVVQGFRNAYAGVTLPNAASVGLHAAEGFTPVGIYREVGYKNGAWHDVGWFERPLAPRVADPPRPRSVPECVADPAFRAALVAGLGVAPHGGRRQNSAQH